MHHKDRKFKESVAKAVEGMGQQMAHTLVLQVADHAKVRGSKKPFSVEVNVPDPIVQIALERLRQLHPKARSTKEGIQTTIHLA